MAERIGTPVSIRPLLSEPVTVLGDGWNAYRDEIRASDRDPGFFKEAPAEAMWPSAVSIGQVAQALLARGEVADTMLAPLYVQPAEAELAWEAKRSVGGPT
jgi:hypothetical protein